MKALFAIFFLNHLLLCLPVRATVMNSPQLESIEFGHAENSHIENGGLVYLNIERLLKVKYLI